MGPVSPNPPMCAVARKAGAVGTERPYPKFMGRYQGKMAPATGLEPVTRRLTAGCSTIELLWNSKGPKVCPWPPRAVKRFFPQRFVRGTSPGCRWVSGPEEGGVAVFGQHADPQEMLRSGAAPVGGHAGSPFVGAGFGGSAGQAGFERGAQPLIGRQTPGLPRRTPPPPQGHRIAVAHAQPPPGDGVPRPIAPARVGREISRRPAQPSWVPRTPPRGRRRLLELLRCGWLWPDHIATMQEIVRIPLLRPGITALIDSVRTY